jgi:hypothetical protein
LAMLSNVMFACVAMASKTCHTALGRINGHA